MNKARWIRNSIRLFCHATVVLAIFSCSSQPVGESKFYLLNQVQPVESNPVASKALTSDQSTTRAYTLQINLPEYLKRPNLVMQINQHQLHYAQLARWAEDLDDGIRKVLTNQLAQSQIILTGDYPTFAPQNRLVLEIEHFYPTDQGKVILSGQYWRVDFTDPLTINKHRFFYEEKLTENGYEQAVVQMRSLLGKLADELAAGL